MDVPRVKEKPSQPVFSPEQIERLILAQGTYSDAERLYLAIATIWASRREALAQLNKRHWNEIEGTLIIPGVHGSETVKHLIPDEIKPLFAAYRLKEHTTRAISYVFDRIAEKAGLVLEDGFGWHSVRRSVTTIVLKALSFDKKILWAYSTGWRKEKIGRGYFGSAMAGYYDHPEILDSDPQWIDREIYQVHPILKLWKSALALNPINQPQDLGEIVIIPGPVLAAMTPATSQESNPGETELDRVLRALKQANRG